MSQPRSSRLKLKAKHPCETPPQTCESPQPPPQAKDAHQQVKDLKTAPLGTAVVLCCYDDDADLERTIVVDAQAAAAASNVAMQSNSAKRQKLSEDLKQVSSDAEVDDVAEDKADKDYSSSLEGDDDDDSDDDDFGSEDEDSPKPTKAKPKTQPASKKQGKAQPSKTPRAPSHRQQTVSTRKLPPAEDKPQSAAARQGASAVPKPAAKQRPTSSSLPDAPENRGASRQHSGTRAAPARSPLTVPASKVTATLAANNRQPSEARGTVSSGLQHMPGAKAMSKPFAAAAAAGSPSEGAAPGPAAHMLLARLGPAPAGNAGSMLRGMADILARGQALIGGAAYRVPGLRRPAARRPQDT